MRHGNEIGKIKKKDDVRITANGGIGINTDNLAVRENLRNSRESGETIRLAQAFEHERK